MKQILGYMKTISKITSKGSVMVVSRVLPKLITNIERISNTCVALAHGPEDSFMSVINLLEEIIDATSSTNNRPISVSLRSASSDDELLKARLAQERLSQEKKSLDAYYAAMQEQIRFLSTNLAHMNLSTIRFAEILKMLKEELKLFGELKKNWDDLVLSFSSFSDQVTTSFRLKFESFFGTTGSTLDTKVSATDQKLFLEIIKEDSADLYHESYVLFVLSRTYYDVSSKYLMPRAAGLSSMLTSSNNNERQALIAKLQQDTEDAQKNIKELIDEQRKKYKKTISKKRTKINEIIDHQGADGN
jgi:hypothetical protein